MEQETKEQMQERLKQLQEEYKKLKPKKKKRIQTYAELTNFKDIEETSYHQKPFVVNAVTRVYEFRCGDKDIFGGCPNCRKKVYFNLIRLEQRSNSEKDLRFWLWVECPRCFMICEKTITYSPFVSMKEFEDNYTSKGGYDKSDKDYLE